MSLVLFSQRAQPMTDPHLDISEEEHRRIRARLITFFRMNAAIDPPALADEVMFRAIRRLYNGMELDCELASFCLGIARFVLKEHRKQHHFEEIAEDYPEQGDGFGSMSRVERNLILNDCLQTVSPEKRQLLLEYQEGDRARLAESRGQTPNALRIEVHRIIQELSKQMRL